jgi:hypothetical protein
MRFDLLAACPQVPARQRVTVTGFLVAAFTDRAQNRLMVGDADTETAVVPANHPVEAIDTVIITQAPHQGTKMQAQ